MDIVVYVGEGVTKHVGSATNSLSLIYDGGEDFAEWDMDGTIYDIATGEVQSEDSYIYLMKEII